MSVNQIGPIELGRRLKNARDSANLTQTDAARVIDVARTTLVAIEKGDRKVRIEELQQLARAYGVSANRLLRREAVHIDLLPRFRRLNETTDPEVLDAAKLLNQLISAEVELENLLGVSNRRDYPPQRPLRPGNVSKQAEDDAQWLRDTYGLGVGALPDIFSFIEITIGIRLYQKPLPAKVSGLFTYDPSVGAAILLNASHPLPRRRQTAAHELGHFVATRDAPEVLDDAETFASREERYANHFGRALLTPADAVKARYQELRAGEDPETRKTLHRRIVILMADAFSVSIEAMVRRMEELGLAHEGTWDWFVRNGGVTQEDKIRVLGARASGPEISKDEVTRPFSPKIGLMAYRAWKKELLTESQLSDLLKVDRLTLRAFLYDLRSEEEGEADDLLKLPG